MQVMHSSSWWKSQLLLRVAGVVTVGAALWTATVPLHARSVALDGTTLLTPQPVGFEHCPQFFLDGRPPLVPEQPLLRQLCYEAFAVLHSGQTRTPVYVAQRLNRRLIEEADERRSDRFFSDARLPAAERAALDDYRKSGYSRGHMAPAGDMPTPSAMAQSFSLANVVPQDIQHNSGAWAKIEQDTRRYVLRARGDVLVFTGPVFVADSPRIGANGVRVPRYLFKLVHDVSTGRSWAHWQENRPNERVRAPISYAQLVDRTGIVFLPGLVPGPRGAP